MYSEKFWSSRWVRGWDRLQGHLNHPYDFRLSKRELQGKERKKRPPAIHTAGKSQLQTLRAGSPCPPPSLSTLYAFSLPSLLLQDLLLLKVFPPASPLRLSSGVGPSISDFPNSLFKQSCLFHGCSIWMTSFPSFSPAFFSPSKMSPLKRSSALSLPTSLILHLNSSAQGN